MTRDELDTLKFHIKHLFTNYLDWNLSDHLSHVSKYYAYLADALNYRRFGIIAEPELIQRFESVFFVVTGQSSLLPRLNPPTNLEDSGGKFPLRSVCHSRRAFSA